MQDEIQSCISELWNLNKDVTRVASDFHGSVVTYRKFPTLMLNVPARLTFSLLLCLCSVSCSSSLNEKSPTRKGLITDIRKPFFFIGQYYLFTISFFFIILVVMVVREGKVPQYQGFRDFCPTTRPTTGSTTEATTGFYFCFNHSSGSPNCSISSVGIS